MTEKTENKVIAETERLVLRELNDDDFPGLCHVLQDEEVTYAYGRIFTDREIRFWLDGQYRHYRDNGYGMWAVVLKETGKMIGHAGICWQCYGDEDVPEIGYMFEKAVWGKGYATEAAMACRDYAFQTLKMKRVYSVIWTDNMASRSVARKNGMRITETVYKPVNGQMLPHYMYSVKNPEK